jgi:hypothetical protein
LFVTAPELEPSVPTYCSDSGDDLDASLVHRLQARGLHRGILVRGADRVVAPAVLVNLARVPLVALINWPELSLTS